MEAYPEHENGVIFVTPIRDEILPGVFLTCLQTDKFKTGLLSVCMLTRLCRENASMNTLIPNVLRRGTVRHPDMDSLAARLDSLYGARIEPYARKIGEMQAIGFWADFIDDAFLPAQSDHTLLEDVCDLLGEILLAPNTRGGLFLPQYVDSEREKLLEDIRALINDKIAYCRYRLIEQMCAAEDYAIDVTGTEETAENIHYVSLTKHYKALLASSPIEIFYCGTADAERVKAALSGALMSLPRGEIDYDLGTDIRMNALEDHIRYETEIMDVTQGKLAIGFRLGECMEEPDLAAIRVMNTIFGGDASSRLFQNVREKQSLCYYASSGIDFMKGLMFVMSGIEQENYQKTLDAIMEQLDDMRAGNITEEELATAKRSLVSGLRAVSDSGGQLEAFWLGQNLLGLEYGPDELAALIEDVTIDDVVAIARSVECDMVYFIKGSEEDTEYAEN